MEKIFRAHQQQHEEENQEWENSPSSEQYRAAAGSRADTSNGDEWLASPKGPEGFCHSWMTARGWVSSFVQLHLHPQSDVCSVKRLWREKNRKDVMIYPMISHILCSFWFNLWWKPDIAACQDVKWLNLNEHSLQAIMGADYLNGPNAEGNHAMIKFTSFSLFSLNIFQKFNISCCLSTQTDQAFLTAFLLIKEAESTKNASREVSAPGIHVTCLQCCFNDVELCIYTALFSNGTCP